MNFRRIDRLPPYVFGTVNQHKLAARRDGEDIIDLGFGNPDIASPPVVVEKLIEAAQKPAQPPLLGQPGAAQPAQSRRRPLSAALRGFPRP